MNPPFKDNAFDLIYSSGVLHHTPDTKLAFDGLTKLVKDKGRIYIWLYGTSQGYESDFWTTNRRGGAINRFVRERITSGLPDVLKHVLFIALILARKSIYPIFSALKIRKLGTRKWSEEMVSIYDFYSAPYQHLHTDTEVSEWFQTNGFKGVTVSESREFGFGIYGDRQSQ